MKFILIVSTNNDHLSDWRNRLDEYAVNASYAYDVSYAVSNQDRYDLVAVETCVGSKTFNTGPLLKSLPAHSNGPIVIVDESSEIRQAMIRDFGCTHGAHPDLLVSLIVTLLELKRYS